MNHLNRTSGLVLTLLVFSVLLGCGVKVRVGSQEWPIELGPTRTPQPTYTPYPTHTPEPTLTPRPTYTPLPTYVPVATPTSAASNKYRFRVAVAHPIRFA
jgi:hypothetical protein